jgi:hypothetical protein
MLIDPFPKGKGGAEASDDSSPLFDDGCGRGTTEICSQSWVRLELGVALNRPPSALVSGTSVVDLIERKRKVLSPVSLMYVFSAVFSPGSRIVFGATEIPTDGRLTKDPCLFPESHFSSA